MKQIVAVPVRTDVYLVVELDEADIDELRNAEIEVVPVEKEDRNFRTGKKGFAFLIPLVAALPSTAMVIGAATLGVVGGAAGVVGNRIGNWFLPKEPTKVEVVK